MINIERSVTLLKGKLEFLLQLDSTQYITIAFYYFSIILQSLLLPSSSPAITDKKAYLDLLLLWNNKQHCASARLMRPTLACLIAYLSVLYVSIYYRNFA